MPSKALVAVSLYNPAGGAVQAPVNLQSSITAGITGYGSSFGDLAGNIIAELGSSPDVGGAMAPVSLRSGSHYKPHPDAIHHYHDGICSH